MAALFPKVTNSISLSYFKMDGKQLSKVLLAAKNVPKVLFSRCCIEDTGFIVWEPTVYKIHELSFTNCRSEKFEWQGENIELKAILIKIASSSLGKSVKKLHVSGNSISRSSMGNIEKNAGFKEISFIISDNMSHLRNHQLLPIY